MGHPDADALDYDRELKAPQLLAGFSHFSIQYGFLPLIFFFYLGGKLKREDLFYFFGTIQKL